MNDLRPLGQLGRKLALAPAHGVRAPDLVIARKRPGSDIERIACLAKYLADARGVHEFKTKDLTSLNTEARQAPIRNPSMAVDNATKAHFLGALGRKGMKQLITHGSDIVDALPDSDEVKRLRQEYADRRRRRGPGKRARKNTAGKKAARGRTTRRPRA